MELKPNELNVFCLFGSLFDVFLKHVISLQQHEFTCACRPKGILGTQITIEKIQNIVSFSLNNLKCKKCLLNGKNNFTGTPLWLFVEINGSVTIE